MFLKKLSDLSNSLLFRLTILYALAFTVLSSIGFLIFYYRIYAVSMESLDIELHAEAHKYSVLLKKYGLKGIHEAIVDEDKFEDPEDGFYRLFDSNGDILMSTDMTGWRTIPKPNFPGKMGHTGLSYEIQTLSVQGLSDKARTITVALTPEYGLQIGENLEEVDDYLDIFLNLFSVLVISLIAISMLIGWLLARRATRDMQEVTDTAEEISKGVYNRRVKVTGQLKEIQRLGVMFNRMLDRIQGLLTSMKEINDNIAHDLRSPLARIRGIAEMNLLKDSSNEDFREMAAGTIEECDILIEMVNTMLDITEAEAGVNETQLNIIELRNLIYEACELFRPIAQSKNIKIEINMPKSLEFQSEKKKLQRIVTNLLENAIKYSTENKTVTVSASTRNDEIVMKVEDNGIGISDEHILHIFKRFYRCDGSRGQGGVGLGLSLVKAYTESLNGSIHVKSVVNQGSCFTLIFKK